MRILAWFLLLMLFGIIKCEPYHNHCPVCVDLRFIEFFWSEKNQHLFNDFRKYRFNYKRDRRCEHSHYTYNVCDASCYRARLRCRETNGTHTLAWAFGCSVKTFKALPSTIVGAPPDLKNIKQNYHFEDHLLDRGRHHYYLEFEVYKYDYDVEVLQVFQRREKARKEKEEAEKLKQIPCEQEIFKCYYEKVMNMNNSYVSFGSGAAALLGIYLICKYFNGILVILRCLFCCPKKKKNNPIEDVRIAYRKSGDQDEETVAIQTGASTEGKMHA